MSVKHEMAVRSILGEQLGANEEEMTNDAVLGDDLGMDELDVVEIVMELENKYGIEISDDDAEKWRAFKDVVDYLDAHVKK